MNSTISFSDIVNAIPFRVDDSYIKGIITICLQNSNNVILGENMHLIFEIDESNKYTISLEEQKIFYKSIIKDAQKIGIDTATIASKIKQGNSQVFKSWEIDTTDEIKNPCHILTINPQASDIMKIMTEIRMELKKNNIPYYIETLPIKELGNGYMEPIKVITNNDYLEQTVNAINNVILRNDNNVRETTTFGARVTPKIGYNSYVISEDEFNHKTQKEIIGMCIEKSFLVYIYSLLEANPTLMLNINGNNIRADEINVTEENIMSIALFFYNNMKDAFVDLIVNQFKSLMTTYQIDLNNFFTTKTAFNSFINVPAISTETIDKKYDINTSINKYINLFTKEELTEPLTCENKEVTNLVSLFDKFKILDNISLDAKVTLLDGTTMSGQQFIKTYGKYIYRFDTLEDFINTYTSSIIKEDSKKSFKGISTLFRKK